MKPIYVAAIIAAIAGIMAKKQFESLKGFLSEEAVTVQQKHDELQRTKDNFTMMLATDRQAKGVAPVLDKYIAAWMGTLPMYEEMTPETKSLKEGYGMRLINNSLNPDHQSVTLAGREYQIALRTYEFGTSYPNALNCFGAFEQKFELFHVRSLELVRQKDELQFGLLLEVPVFENISI